MKEFMTLLERLTAATEKVAEIAEGLSATPAVGANKKEPEIILETPDPANTFPVYTGWSTAKIVERCHDRGIVVRNPGSSRNRATKALVADLMDLDRKEAALPQPTEEPEEREEKPEVEVGKPKTEEFFPPEPDAQQAPDPFAPPPQAPQQAPQAQLISHDELLQIAKTTMDKVNELRPGTGKAFVYETTLRVAGVPYVIQVPEDKRLAVAQALSEGLK